MKRHYATLAAMGLFLGANLSQGISSSPDKDPAPDTNCTLTVRQISHTGETESQIYTLKVADEKSCKKAANRHETNFAPQSVKKKTVKMKWGGG